MTVVMDKPCGGLRGMPRPIAQHNDTMRPVPWSQGKAWGSASVHRQQIAQVQSRCLVCGEIVYEGVVFVRTELADKYDESHGDQNQKDSFTINDLPQESVVVEGALHIECAKLARAHCKPIRERLKDGIYVEKPYVRGRYKPGTKPKIEYR